MNSASSELDHLVYAGPDLEEAVGTVEALLGADGTPGGRHPGLGTRNVLFSLGSSCYLEVIGPDTEQPEPAQPRPFGIDRLGRPRLVTWAIRPAAGLSIARFVERADRAGVALGPVLPMSRRRPDGEELHWKLTGLGASRSDVEYLQPFVIDWEATSHPAQSLPEGPRFDRLAITCPAPEGLCETLAILAVPAEVCAVRTGAVAITAVLEVDGAEITLS